MGNTSLCASRPRSGERTLRLFFIWRLARKPMHGYQILGEVQDMGLIWCKPSTVYSILSSLERDGLVRSRTSKAAGRTRKTYSTTAAGEAKLAFVKKNKIKGVLRQFMEELLS